MSVRAADLTDIPALARLSLLVQELHTKNRVALLQDAFRS